MKRQVNRRSILGFFGATAAAAIGPIALGWRRIVAEAAGTSGHGGPGSESAPSASAIPSGLTVAPPAEAIVFIGFVDSASGNSQFIGSNQKFTGVTVNMSQASPIYPKGHVPREGDRFVARGHWEGGIGTSTFDVEFVDFNGKHIMGALSTARITDPEANYSTVDAATGDWQLILKAANLTHFAIHATASTPTDALLTFPSGTAADIIGYQVRPGVLVVTWLEVHP